MAELSASLIVAGVGVGVGTGIVAYAFIWDTEGWIVIGGLVLTGGILVFFI